MATYHIMPIELLVPVTSENGDGVLYFFYPNLMKNEHTLSLDSTKQMRHTLNVQLLLLSHCMSVHLFMTMVLMTMLVVAKT